MGGRRIPTRPREKRPPKRKTLGMAGGLHGDSTALWGLLSIPRQIRPFTPEEDEIIRNWPQDRSLRELAETLGREYGTVKVRYWRLRGLKTRPQPRSSRRRARRGSPEDWQRIRNLCKLLVVTAHLRRESRLRGELATAPSWIERLLQAVSRHARRQRSLGQPSFLDEPDFLDEFFRHHSPGNKLPPLADALGAGPEPQDPNGPGAAWPESQHGHRPTDAAEPDADTR